MTSCERCAALMPWMLNRTLESGEEAALREHLATCAECRAERERARAALALAGAHPPPAALVALSRGEELPDRERVAAHVRGCASCSEELALARASHRLSSEGARERWTATATSPLWRWGALAATLLALLGFGGWLWTAVTRPAATTAASVAPDARPAAPDRAATATDAEAMRESERAALALREDLARSGQRVRELEGQLAELRAPVLNARVLEVHPEVVLRGGEQTANDVSIARDDPAVTLLLTATSGARPGPHRVELVAPGGEVLWRAEGLELQPTGDFALTVPADLLPEGRVTVRLEPPAEGSRGGGAEAARYVLTVRRRG